MPRPFYERIASSAVRLLVLVSNADEIM